MGITNEGEEAVRDTEAEYRAGVNSISERCSYSKDPSSKLDESYQDAADPGIEAALARMRIV